VISIVALTCAVVASGAGCGTVRQCNEEAGIANVAGDWLLSAEGSWDGCAVNGFESGDLTMEAEVTLPVVQGTGADEGRLWLAEPVDSPDSAVTFSGTVEGSCIDFTLVESGAGYELRYEFEGAIDGTEISGGFTGTARTCKTEGDFTVTVFSSSRAPPSEQDGGPDVDGGGGDSRGGDVSGGDPAATGDTGQSSARECYRTEDCAAGYCQNGQCISVCDGASDCAVGETCTQGRCEPAEGCACTGEARAGEPAFSLVLGGLLCVIARRRRRAAPGATVRGLSSASDGSCYGLVSSKALRATRGRGSYPNRRT
jgi:hypothetical protein